MKVPVLDPGPVFCPECTEILSLLSVLLHVHSVIKI